MNCSGCGGKLSGEDERCPHCGQPNPLATGMYRTSTVLISKGRRERVYRSVEEAPENLRAQLRKSLKGVNSATILIADRRGRQEIGKALGGLSGAGRRWQAIAGIPSPGAPAWLTQRRKATIAALVFALALAAIAAALLVHWR
jgi:hypothetical protein